MEQDKPHDCVEVLDWALVALAVIAVLGGAWLAVAFTLALERVPS